jgi:hypothetical protein
VAFALGQSARNGVMVTASNNAVIEVEDTTVLTNDLRVKNDVFIAILFFD